ncbi:MAG: pilus assembly protein [Hydrogenophaga sp.]
MQTSFTPALAMLMGFGLCASALAAPLSLSQTPKGGASEPAPNIIVSVDNSSSMGSTGISQLKTALKATFSEANVPDNRIRLAWQSMHHCRGIPGDNSICKGFNGIRPLGGAHRANFMSWVDSLKYSSGTPSHFVVDNAGKYLSETGLGANSPWAAVPGVQEAPVLSCRKAYNIFMTDGEWGHAWHKDELDTSGPDGKRIVRGGNADGTATTLPDGTAYTVDAGNMQTRLYRDTWGNAGLSTLSDLAFHYWSRDLQPSIPNNVVPTPRQQFPAQNFGTAAAPAVLDTYWNPRNNPATWQHMVNYTIGFKSAASWSAASNTPTWQGDTFTGLGPLLRAEHNWDTPFCNAQINGPGTLPCDGDTNYEERDHARKAELWHMALNSRGRFIPAPNAQSLVDAFQGILKEIINDNLRGLVSIAVSSTRLRADGLAYLAGFDSTKWSGQLSAHKIDAKTHVISATPTWEASTSLDAPGLNLSQRLILSHSGESGIPFLWSSLSTEQQNVLKGSDSDTVGQSRLAYLRGDRSKEESHAGGTMRDRASRLGDIVNSNIWNTGKPARLAFEHNGHAEFRSQHATRADTLYVGANDGMLHAFNAADGVERMAYVPRGVYSKLRAYTLPGYAHQYTVDGHPFTGDADISAGGPNAPSEQPNWRTILVGSTGSGARGYFVLDVTDPTQLSTASVLVDRTFPSNSTGAFTGHQDVGHIVSPPVVDDPLEGRSEQIVKLNNKRWAVVMGNGANSFNERPVLLIQYLDGDRAMLRIVADSTLSQSNGLSAPRPVDINGDGTMDVVYAGDLRGQLWKFDLTSTNQDEWGVSDWDGSAMPCKNANNCKPFYVATDNATTPNRQPITSAPVWMAHPLGGVQVMFGTGQNLQDTDPLNTNVQTVYALWDKSTYSRENGLVADDVGAINASAGRSMLVQQSFTGAVTRTDPDTGAALATEYSNSTASPVNYSRTDASAKRGWYLDFPLSGERVLTTPFRLPGNLAAIFSTVPTSGTAGESCDELGINDPSRLTVLNMITGRPSYTPVFFSGDATMDMRSASSVKVASHESAWLQGSRKKLRFMNINNATGSNGDENGDSGTQGGSNKVTGKNLNLDFPLGARADWREVR